MRKVYGLVAFVMVVLAITNACKGDVDSARFSIIVCLMCQLLSREGE